MHEKIDEAGKWRPREQQDGDDVQYSALATQTSNWTGNSVSDIPETVLDHFPELLEAENLSATVPQEYRGLVRGTSIETDAHNSCAFKEYSVRVFAIDQAGQALIQKTTYHAYEDVADKRFEIVPQAVALALAEQYRRDSTFLAATSPDRQLVSDKGE